MPTPWTLSDDERLTTLERLGHGDHSIAVIIPAKDEATTIGAVIDAVRASDIVISELVVVNDHSVDDTATVARRHGARVIDVVGATGKGSAMTTGVAATTSEIVVFLDGDVVNTQPHFVPSLVAPLVARASIVFVKAFYVRPLHDMPSGGGRVNELAARPILSLLYPGLGEIRQPLAGETAVRREALNQLTLADGYSVEVALLLDVAARYGVDAIAQVDIGIRRHRNRPLEELRPMATEMLRAALTRYGVELPTQ
jgi:glucosyl-3-phosphoglycerate synthase